MSRVIAKPNVIHIGAKDHGRTMTLADFEFARVEPGCQFELSRGVITVSDVPSPDNFFVEQEVREQLTIYKVAHADVISALAGGSNCKLLVNDFESERHPDLSIYKTRPKTRGRKVWRSWLPEIVIEIVSLTSVHRDYVEKREEYLALGIKEYWIIDPAKNEMLALCRYRNQWRETVLTSADSYDSRLLPGFRLDLAKVFAAGEKA